MQSAAARADSRARRSASLDARLPRVYRPVNSRATLHPSLPQSPLVVVLLSFAEAFSCFSAAALLYRHKSLPPPLLAFPAFFVALVASMLLSLPLPPLVRVGRQASSWLPRLIALHVARITALLLALRLVGPAKSLIAFGARRPLASPRASPRAAILALFALALLARDASVPSQATHVAAHLKRMSTAAVHPRRLVASLRRAATRRRTGNDVELEHPDQGNTVFKSDDVVQLPEAVVLAPMQLPAPPATDANKQNAGIPAGERVSGFRRRLLATIKDETLVTEKGINSSTFGEHANLTAREGSLGKQQRQKEPAGLKEHAGVGANDADTSDSSEESHGSVRSVTPDAETGVQGIAAVVGIILATSSALAASAASDLEAEVAGDIGEDSAMRILNFMSCSCLLLPLFILYWLVARRREESYLTSLFSVVVPRGILIGFALLVLPLLLQHRSRGLLRRSSAPPSRTASKPTQVTLSSRISSSIISVESSLMNMRYVSPRILSQYSFTLASMALLRSFSPSIFGFSDSLTFSTFISASILLLVSITSDPPTGHPSQSDAVMRERQRTSSSSDLSVHLSRSLAHKVQVTLEQIRGVLFMLVWAIKDLLVHSRTNKASGQVLNFLVLQSAMATVELVYATVTESTGFISISADNFFCCIALAIGLFAIRATSRKPTALYTYGFARVESVCGFVNGVMLVFVAVLIILESFERLYEPESVAIGRSFVVCLFGMTGNVLGLYFFPPEYRRENHNVQGIYLHIWANTLAFASMAISTAITTAVPGWEIIDVGIATLVGAGITSLALPLVIRSSRVLLLLPPSEKVQALAAAKRRISDTDGIVKVSGLRLWNLAPNCLVASCRVELAESHKGKDCEVLYKLRSVFASMGVPASQCTIQISRVESEKPAVIFFHKRTRSGYGDTGIELESSGTREVDD